MKKIKYLSLLLFFVLIACSDNDTEPVLNDFTGTWSGNLGCSVESVSVSFSVVLNIQADEARCDNCYTVGFSNGGQDEDVLMASLMNGELIFERSTVDLGDMDGMVSIEGTCRVTSEDTMELILEMNQVSGENFGFACTSILTSQ